jgi:preprotein translocase subunit SecA
MEGQRQRIQERRQVILESDQSELERLVAVRTIDDLWSVYLETVTELRAGIHWQGYTGHDPLYAYLTKVDALYRELEESIEPETAARLEEARASGVDPSQRGATWTYLTTDMPFGDYTERVIRGLTRKVAKHQLWG